MRGGGENQCRSKSDHLQVGKAAGSLRDISTDRLVLCLLLVDEAVDCGQPFHEVWAGLLHQQDLSVCTVPVADNRDYLSDDRVCFSLYVSNVVDNNLLIS